MWLQPEFPHVNQIPVTPPAFIEDMKINSRLLGGPSPEAVIRLTQQTASYEQTSQTAGVSPYMVGWRKQQKQKTKHRRETQWCATSRPRQPKKN